MSISHLQLVNQKLAFAGAIIHSLTRAAAEPTAQKLSLQALKDAAVFHMITALHFYNRELAELHHIKNLHAINSVQYLASALIEAEKFSSAASELLELSQTKGCWLHQLTHYYAGLLTSPEKPKEKKAFNLEGLIELVDVSEVDEQEAALLTPEVLNSWLDSFRALIIRQRDTCAEY